MNDKELKERINALLDIHLSCDGMAELIYNHDILSKLPNEVFERVPKLYRGLVFDTIIRDKHDIYCNIKHNRIVSFSADVNIAKSFYNKETFKSYASCLISIENVRALSIRKLAEWVGRKEMHMVANEAEYICEQPVDYNIESYNNSIKSENYIMTEADTALYIEDIICDYKELIDSDINMIIAIGKNKDNIMINLNSPTSILITNGPFKKIYKRYWNRSKMYSTIDIYNPDIMIIERVVFKNNGRKIVNLYHVDGKCSVHYEYNENNECDIISTDFTDEGILVRKIIDYKNMNIKVMDGKDIRYTIEMNSISVYPPKFNDKYKVFDNFYNKDKLFHNNFYYDDIAHNLGFNHKY